MPPNGHDQRARPVMLAVIEVSVGRAPLHWMLGGTLKETETFHITPYPEYLS